MSIDRTFMRKASVVYAETLLSAVRDEGFAFDVSRQLESVLTIIRGNPELRNTLADRMLPVETRTGLVKEVFAGLNASLVAVLVVMVERGDVSLLARINEAYIDRVEEALDAVIIAVPTVVELAVSLRNTIREKYSAQFGKGVLLREHIDPALVGGIVLSTHGRRIDASVVSQLESARTVLSQA